MHRSTSRWTSRWTTAAAAAALIALPVAGAAQTTGAGASQQPPAQTQPQQPAAQQPASSEQAPQTGQVDANAAKKHLSDARETLSQITSMPEAAKLQGENRTQVSQLISNFNDLITTQADWRSAYAKVDANLNSLLGAEGSDPAAAGTTGTTGAGATATAGTSGAAAAAPLEPAIRAKLTEFRAQLKQFEQAAGGGQEQPAAGAASAANAPAAASANSANPAAAGSTSAASPTAATGGQPPSSGATGTSGVTTSPTASMDPADQARAAGQVAHSQADRELDTISEILNSAKTGVLTKAQTAELKKHVEQLRALLKQDK